MAQPSCALAKNKLDILLHWETMWIPNILKGQRREKRKNGNQVFELSN